MFAPAHHPAMKNVGPTRVELGTRTIFNLLGPLSNPASVKRQMVGVFSQQWIEPLAQVLKNLGSECVWVVHGSDGLDEITTAGPTSVAALENGKIRTFEITPEDVGLPRAKPEALRGGDAEHNAEALLDVLKGKPSAVPRRRDLERRGRVGGRRQGEGLEGRRRARRQIDRQRRSGRQPRPADRGVQRRGGVRSRWPTSCKKIEAYKREEIAAAKRARPLGELEARREGGRRRRAAFSRAIERKHRRRRLRADRRDQEGEPVEGPDPRRFRSAGAGQGL